MSETTAVLDWTAGEEGVAYQRCPACSSVWYFRRSFCPRCGSAPPDNRQASGLGTVHAMTLVTRAPSDELRPHAPYLIVLIDADEGFRLMAHGSPPLKIGERVRCRFVSLAGKLIPSFEKVDA
jgi:uncharacterized OB-fold protein